MRNKLIISAFILSVMFILMYIVGSGFIKYQNNLKEIPVVKTDIAKTDIGELKGNSYESILSYINRKGKTMLVVGKSGCTYCNMYLPVLERTSNTYNYQYMYVDVKVLNENDFYSLMNSDQILIPAKCSDYGEDSKLNRGFGTPITIIFDNGHPYDCIRGYKDSSIVYDTLINSGYIK